MEKGGFFAKHKYGGVVYTECQREKKKKNVSFIYYMNISSSKKADF